MRAWNVEAHHAARDADTRFTVEAPDRATAEEYAALRAPGFTIDSITEAQGGS